MEISEILAKKNIFLVVGATTNQEKYGFKVFQDLLNSEYKVFPINPNYENILGVKCYNSIDSFKKNFDTVIFVIPPDRVLEVLKNTTSKIENIWLQPGSENEEIIKYCEKNNINCIHDMCVMVQKK